MDRSSLDCVRELLPYQIPPATQALLLIEVDGHRHDVQERAAAIENFCRAQQAAFVLMADSAEETEKLWKARKLLSQAAFKLGPHKLSEDVVVPITLIPDLVHHIENISREIKIAHSLLRSCRGWQHSCKCHVQS